MSKILKRLFLPSPTGAARQTAINNAGIISKPVFQCTLFVLFIVTILASVTRFRLRRSSPKALSDYLAIIATSTACIATLFLLVKSPTMYLMEAMNRRHITSVEGEVNALIGLGTWTRILLPLSWLPVFAIKFSFLSRVRQLVTRRSKGHRIHFWLVVVYTFGCWVFMSVYMNAACMGKKRARETNVHVVECLTTYPMFPGRKYEAHDQFISALSGKLDILSDVLVSSVALVARTSSPMQSIPKSTIAVIAILFVAKLLASVLRVVVTTPYMGFAYTWSFFWLMLEGYMVIVLEAKTVLSGMFEEAGIKYMELLDR